MVPTLCIIAVTAIIAVIEIPILWRNKHKKELWVFSILLLIGSGINVAQSLRVPIPSPLTWLTVLLKPVYDSAMHFLT